MSLSGKTDLLKLYARQAKLKQQIYLRTIKRLCHPDGSKCMLDKNDEDFLYVIIDTTDPQNRTLHDKLHIVHTGRLCFPRQFEASRLITFHSRLEEDKPVYI